MRRPIALLVIRLFGQVGGGSSATDNSDSRLASAGTKSRPGLVQSWPALPVTDCTKPVTIASPRSLAAAWVTKAGLTLPSSP